MPDNRDILRSSANLTKPPATRRTEKKRKAPDKAATRDEQAYDERRWGKPTTWKLHPDTKPAVDRAARTYEVSRRDLVDFLLRAGLHLLASGRVELPLEKNDRPGAYYTIKLQGIPEEFQGE